MSPIETEELVRRAAETLRAHGAREVYVFGSFARGGVGPESDIDMAVAGLPPEQFFAAAGAATVSTGRLVDVIDLDSATPFGDYLRASGELRSVA